MNRELIDLIKSGNKGAFQELFDLYYNALSAFGYKYVTDVFEVEDVVQDVFISFWEVHKKFDHINAVKAFLYTSVRNKCLNYLKHQSIQKKHEPELIYELESDQFFTNHVIEEETFNQLYAEVSKLPEAAQSIMLLALKGLKNREIAASLNISENTVKTQKKISYAKLKDNLSPLLNALLLTF